MVGQMDRWMDNNLTTTLSQTSKEGKTLPNDLKYNSVGENNQTKFCFGRKSFFPQTYFHGGYLYAASKTSL